MAKKTYKVQKCISLRGKLPSGVKVGRVWETIATFRNETVAEQTAKNARVDNPDNEIRIAIK